MTNNWLRAETLVAGVAIALLIGITPADAQAPSPVATATPDVVIGSGSTAPLPPPAIAPIGPATDLAAAFRPGVPVEAHRAALRRAWFSDPAIRDFVGMTEDVLQPQR